MAKSRKKRRRKAGMLLLELILAGVLCFLAALGILYYMEKNPGAAAENTDVLVVLGAQVYSDGSLSPQLQLRMEAARDSYFSNPRLIICCGAQGKNEPAPEGESMRAWLIQQGVPAADVLAETESYNTYQNLENARALMPEGVKSVTVVTSDYHLPRAMAIARDLGLSAQGIGSPCLPEYWLKNHCREVLAWGKYFLNKIL